MSSYFSDRENGPRPRIKQDLDLRVWGGIYAQIQKRIEDGSLGFGFPLECEDGGAVSGCDSAKMELTIRAEIPELEWPLKPDSLPSMMGVFDLIELLYRSVGSPIQLEYHSYWRHHHLNFDRVEGQTTFRDDLNRIFARNGIAFELTSEGQIIRLAPEILREDLNISVFNTGDQTLDTLLESARIKFLDPDFVIRRESLEKLWDAWERLKTLEVPGNKKKSIEALIAKVDSGQLIFDKLNAEANELTSIGNGFMIRHTEIDKVPITASQIVDYLFHRLFALIVLLLRASGRYATKDVEPVSRNADGPIDDIPF